MKDNFNFIKWLHFIGSSGIHRINLKVWLNLLLKWLTCTFTINISFKLYSQFCHTLRYTFYLNNELSALILYYVYVDYIFVESFRNSLANRKLSQIPIWMLECFGNEHRYWYHRVWNMWFRSEMFLVINKRRLDFEFFQELLHESTFAEQIL